MRSRNGARSQLHPLRCGLVVLQSGCRAGIRGAGHEQRRSVHGTVGGLAPILGNNPLAFAAPSSPGVPLPSLDIATSVVAWGRVAAAARDERDIPEAWAMGPDGRPTTAPERALEGSLLPMGDYKGFGLAFMNDVLTACVTGLRGARRSCTTGVRGRCSATA